MDKLLVRFEREELKQCESIIFGGLSTFMDVGNALLKIRDNKLYRSDFRTFEDYCKKRWDMEPRNANLVIAASKSATILGSIDPKARFSEGQLRPLTSLKPDEQKAVWEKAKEIASKETERKYPTSANIQNAIVQLFPGKSTATVHVSDDSYEWYTPKEYISAARKVMGTIDVDPASCHDANKVVCAKLYFTKENNGLTKEWSGNVWLNPPYNMPLIAQFVNKVICEYKAQSTSSAVVLVNNATDTDWFHQLLGVCSLVCFPDGRVKFWSSSGPNLGARQGQAIFYLGHNSDVFRDEFCKFGVILREYKKI